MADNIQVNFKSGLLTNLPSKPDNGTLYFVTDEKAIYLGNGTTSPVRFGGDIEKVNSISALPASGNSNKLYYAASENILAYWNGSQWIQINAAGLSQVEKKGTGNVLSAVSIVPNAKGEKVLTFETATVATSEELETVESDISSLKTRMGTAETAIGTNTNAIATLNGSASTAGSVAKAVADAKTDILGNVNSDYNTLAKLEGKIKANASAIEKNAEDIADNASSIGTNVTDITNLKALHASGSHNGKATVAEEIASVTNGLNTRLSTAEGEIDDIQADIATINSNITTANGKIDANTADISTNAAAIAANAAAIATLNGTGNGSVSKTVADKIAEVIDDAPDDFDTLKEIADWIANDTTGAAKMQSDIGDLKTRTTAIEGKVSALESTSSSQGANVNHILTALGMTSGTARTSTVTKEITDAVSGLQNTITGSSSDASSKLSLYGIKALANEAKTQAATNATNITNLTTTVNGHTSSIATNASAITTLNGSDSTSGSVANKIKVAVDGLVNGASDGYKTLKDLENKIKTNATNISTNTTTIGQHTTSISNLNTAVEANASNISGLTSQLTWGTF